MKQQITEIKKVNEEEYLMITREANDNCIEVVIDVFAEAIVLLVKMLFKTRK